MALQKSLYEIAEHQQDKLLNTGYSYEGNLFKNTMSTYMFLDPTRSGILAMMEKVVFQLIENVKTIKLQADVRKSRSSNNQWPDYFN